MTDKTKTLDEYRHEKTLKTRIDNTKTYLKYDKNIARLERLEDQVETCQDILKAVKDLKTVAKISENIKPRKLVKFIRTDSKMAYNVRDAEVMLRVPNSLTHTVQEHKTYCDPSKAVNIVQEVLDKLKGIREEQKEIVQTLDKFREVEEESDDD